MLSLFRVYGSSISKYSSWHGVGFVAFTKGGRKRGG